MNAISAPDAAPTTGTVEDFTEYVQARHTSLLRAAYLITGNRHDAEDLLQTALAKVYLAWPKIRDKGAADFYVRRALVNTRTSQWRRRRVDEYATEVMPEQPDWRDPFAESDMRETLWKALTRLTPRQRSAVVLRYYLELTEAETADILGVTTGTIKSTMHRAFSKLRTDATLQPARQAVTTRPQLALAG
jgi:RNA polymerase sigma-70 factor (sigma-E family)